VQAREGDLVVGTIAPPSTLLSVELYDNGNAKPRVLGISSTGRLGFIAPTSGTYRLQVLLTGTQNASYSLKLSPPVSPSVRMRGVHVQPHATYRSERVSKLFEHVQSGRLGEVERLWEEVRKAGGYLIEPLRETDQELGRPPDDLLVTFFWKATYDTYNVLFSWFGSARPEDYYMSHVPGTDVWYKTLRVYRDSRFSYTLSPNDCPEDRALTSQPDPANPVSAYGGSVSVFATQNAPVEWYRKVPARRGLVQEKRFESALLGGAYPVWIYTPPDYAANAGPYPLVILFDGEGYVANFDDRRRLTPIMLDNLIDQGRMRPAVVCFLGGFRGTRNGLAPLNEVSSDSVATELLPWLTSMYAISVNPRDIVIGGYSAGGTKASLVALKYPTLFGNVLSQSGAFRGPVNTHEPNFIARLFVRAERVPIRFYLDVGLYDPGGSVRADDESNTAGNRHFRDVLQAKGYEVIYRETGGAHEFVHWSATLAEALIALLSPGR
jgi:enterochelin esterase family protein